MLPCTSPCKLIYMCSRPPTTKFQVFGRIYRSNAHSLSTQSLEKPLNRIKKRTSINCLAFCIAASCLTCAMSLSLVSPPTFSILGNSASFWWRYCLLNRSQGLEGSESKLFGELIGLDVLELFLDVVALRQVQKSQGADEALREKKVAGILVCPGLKEAS